MIEINKKINLHILCEYDEKENIDSLASFQTVEQQEVIVTVTGRCGVAVVAAAAVHHCMSRHI